MLDAQEKAAETKCMTNEVTMEELDKSVREANGSVNLSCDGGGPYVPPPKVFLFFYSKSLPQTKPLDPPVNS